MQMYVFMHNCCHWKRDITSNANAPEQQQQENKEVRLVCQLYLSMIYGPS